MISDVKLSRRLAYKVTKHCSPTKESLSFISVNKADSTKRCVWEKDFHFLTFVRHVICSFFRLCGDLLNDMSFVLQCVTHMSTQSILVTCVHQHHCLLLMLQCCMLLCEHYWRFTVDNYMHPCTEQWSRYYVCLEIIIMIKNFCF